MKPNTFLEKVLPDTGCYCVLAYKGSRPRQFFVNTIDDIIIKSRPYLEKGYDLYFALSSFKNSNSREASNVLGTKSFFLDIDCGKGKPYASKRKGLTAFRAFLNQTGLPAPSIVDSGNGYHVYWGLDKTLPRSEWLPIAQSLKAACKKFEFSVDPVVTSDAARVLRIPGTVHFKDPDNVKEVKVVRTAPVVSLVSFAGPLQALNLPTTPAPSAAPIRDAVTDALAGNIQHSFAAIVRKSLTGAGCAQIKYILQHQADIDEPLWRSGLSIAYHCKDWEVAIQKMSMGHPEYTKERTIQKAKLIPKPHTCDTFNLLNPDVCSKCTLKIKSPIMIDRQLREPSEDDEDLFVQKDDEPAEPEKVTPSYKLPKHYMKGINGGIYRQIPQEGGGYEPKLVYEYDIYPVTRMNDGNDSQCTVVCIHFPHDPVKEFTARNSELLKTDKGTAILRDNGVVVSEAQSKEIIVYLSEAIKMLQRMRAAQIAHLQYGWTPKNKAFIVGHRQYTTPNAEIKRNFASSSTSDTIELFESEGTFEQWREGVNVYKHENLKPQAIVFLAGFGSPLMTFTGQDGAVINLVSNESGTGKSTAGKAAMSIWGNPRQLLLNYNDTSNARIHRTGVMSNLPVVMDEMTNVTAEDVSNLLYSIASGRDRNRMRQHSNTERINKSLWNLLVLTNSNASMMDKVGMLKSTPDGEAARLLEFHVKEQFIPGAAEKFALLDSNFGWAGDIYATWLVQNVEFLESLVRKQMARIDRLAKTSNKERFWVAGAATIVAGGRIAYDLGLHELNMNEVEEWLVEYFTHARTTLENHSVNYADVISEFLLVNVNSILTVNGSEISGMTGSTVHRAPSNNSLRARLEPMVSTIWLNRSEFGKYCSQMQITMDAALLASDGVRSDFTYVGKCDKRMFAGTGMTLPPIPALEFTINNGAEPVEELFA